MNNNCILGAIPVPINFLFVTSSPLISLSPGSSNVAFSHTISMESNVSMYNMSWDAPGKSFALDYALMNITGCNFDTYRVLHDHEGDMPAKLCSVTCPNEGITEAVARQTCNGTGCCSVSVEIAANSLQLMFVRHGKGNYEPDTHSNRSSLWNTINITTV